MLKRVCGVLLAVVPCVALAAGTTTTSKPETMSKKEIDAKFDQLFNAVDTDGDGKISRAEADLKVPAMAENFDAIDANHDGFLTKAEIKTFAAAQEKRRLEFAKKLQQADKDKNGLLTRDETKVLPGLYAHFDEVDANHDGQLSIKEVADFLRGGNPAPAQAAPAAAPAAAPFP